MPSEQYVADVVDGLFRREAGKLTAILTRWLGIARMDLAEDLVQDTLMKALRLWPYKGVPENPSAWLLRVAKNSAVDVIRRERSLQDKLTAEQVQDEGWLAGVSSVSEEPIFNEWDVEDDQLRLMFTCCHPNLTRDSQVALILKTLCGFSVEEIARAFLVDPATIAQRIVRAKRSLKDIRVSFVFPDASELHSRLDAILKALYLLFNEGYAATSGPLLTRNDLCLEAISLLRLLARRPQGDTPKSHALLALMLFHASRLPARTNPAGEMLLLEEQDRNLWDRAMIQEAFLHLQASTSGHEVTSFHLEAGIASAHAAASCYAKTNWRAILAFYDRLMNLQSSPIIALNRAIALAEVEGPASAIAFLNQLGSTNELDSYALYHASLGSLYVRIGEDALATPCLRRAAMLAKNDVEQRFIRRKLENLNQGKQVEPYPFG